MRDRSEWELRISAGAWRRLGTGLIANVDQAVKLISVTEAADRLGICEGMTRSLLLRVRAAPHLARPPRPRVQRRPRRQDPVPNSGGRQSEDAAATEPRTTDPSGPRLAPCLRVRRLRPMAAQVQFSAESLPESLADRNAAWRRRVWAHRLKSAGGKLGALHR